MVQITDIQATAFLRRRGGDLEQRLRLQVRNDGGPAAAGVRLDLGAWCHEVDLGELPSGESWHDLFIPESRSAAEVGVQALSAAGAGERRLQAVPRPRRWTVHVVQISHHDLGYTSLPSRVLGEHDTWIERAIQMAGDTRRYPVAARFRIVIEQAWSVEHALRHAPPRRAARLVELLRRGQFELTALYGNLTTELCGHEALVRALYPAFELRRRYGIPIVSAEHNDIPGFAWGLSEVLAGAGVRLICPGLPLYYSWGGRNLPSFWDDEAVFGRHGVPGAFWWESPSGQRLLFWCNNRGCGGDCRGTLPGLPKRLLELQTQGYPHDVLRWPVLGGARDNSPYSAEYADTIREWNRTWAWPRLVCSTNACFLDDLARRCDLSALPVRRGDVPGQDYPVGATSTAAATAVNRRTHADLPAAEALATAAALHAQHAYPAATIAAAWRDVLLHDEHTWGHHLPCGPASAASDLEKAVHAYRAAAWTHDVARQAMARVADALRLETADIHLVVFNPQPYERSGLVCTPLREIDNAGSDMVRVPPDQDPAGVGHLRGVILNTRWPVHPPPELVAGGFKLVDVATGSAVPYQIIPVDSPFDPEPYAAPRLGLGSGDRRYGLFEAPQGLARTLCFQAGPVPGLGYRAYRLAAGVGNPAVAAGASVSGTVIENRHWRLAIDGQAGFVKSLRDNADGREWIDASAPHPFGALVVQDPSGTAYRLRCDGVETVYAGPLGAALRSRFTVHGHPRVELTVRLWADVPWIELCLVTLKDPTPLLQASLAFPFALPGGSFACDTPLCTYDPVRDRLPGTFPNRFAVQNWVRVGNDSASVLWSSLDAPVVSLGHLWPPRVSPAHSCVCPPGLEQPPPAAAEPRGGAIYSCITYNNLGTNFAVAQSGPLVFRYRFQPLAGLPSPAVCAAFGADAVTPFQTMFTRRGGAAERGALPALGGFLRISPQAVQMLALKQAEDGRGVVLRLWNPTAAAVPARVEVPGMCLRAVEAAALTEEPAAGSAYLRDGAAEVTVAPHAVVTLRLMPTAADQGLY